MKKKTYPIVTADQSLRRRNKSKLGRNSDKKNRIFLRGRSGRDPRGTDLELRQQVYAGVEVVPGEGCLEAGEELRHLHQLRIHGGGGGGGGVGSAAEAPLVYSRLGCVLEREEADVAD